MVILLTPKQISDQKKQGAEETRIRVSSLAREESELTFRINLLRQDEEDYLKRKSEHENATYPEIEVKKTVLLKEVDTLEARKAEAMKPIDELYREADATLRNAQQVGVLNKELERINLEEKNSLVERSANLEKQEEDSTKRKESLDARETTIERKEKELSKQIDDFAEKVSAHSLTVVEEDRAMTRRENALQADMKLLAVTAEEQAKRKIEQDNKDREIASKYAALAAAVKETGIQV